MNDFRNAAAEFVFYRTYSRWIDILNRRETWDETVSRYMSFIRKHRGTQVPEKVLKKIGQAIRKQEVMPSMRALWAAGDAAEQDNTCIYNCSFIVIDSVEAFSEGLQVLMCGSGWGFSVEDKYVSQLPEVPGTISAPSPAHYLIPDTKEGWADSLKVLMINLYAGADINFDYSAIRPKGSKLKIMGGRSSGPAPLITLHDFVRQSFYNARGRKLTTLEAHDICNQVGDIVVSGGVRRSSEISLSDLSDELMANAKTGDFPVRRYMANNSAVYLKKPTAAQFLHEWAILANSGSGERGIFNLGGMRERAPKRRDASQIVGTNPCAEIALRDNEFCNLSEVVVRADDDADSLLEKVDLATWIGAIQSSFTYFPYLNPQWKKNCDEERLLGVSLTGQMDAPGLLTPDVLKLLKSRALKVAKKAAAALDIPMSASITCTKPSGTVSQLVDSASGIHPRFAKYYIRRYRISAVDPLCKMLQGQKFPMSPENGQRKSDWTKAAKAYETKKSLGEARSICSTFTPDFTWSEDLVNTWVLEFPCRAPEGAKTTSDFTAIQQLEYYKNVQENFAEHNASNTIYVKDDEWFEVGNWVYKNWDIIGGVSFLPSDNSRYEQMPYEEITAETYINLVNKLKPIDYSQLSLYEAEDNTTGALTLACVGGSCNLD